MDNATNSKRFAVITLEEWKLTRGCGRCRKRLLRQKGIPVTKEGGMALGVEMEYDEDNERYLYRWGADLK